MRALPAVFERRGVHYGWVVVAVSFLTLITAAGFRSTAGVLIVPLQDEFGWSRATLGGAVAINLVLYGFGGPFAAGLYDRVGVRRVIVTAGVASPVSFALAALHVAAAGAWLGCVVVALAGPSGSARRVARYGVAAAVLLVLSGVVLALGHFGGLADLVETAYGEAFLVKLFVVAIALAFGALARRRAELVAAAGALAAATVLVSLLPPP